VLPVLEELTAPAVEVELPAVLALPAVAAEVAAPLLLECAPADAWKFGSMVLLWGSLQATPMPNSKVVKTVILLERLRMFLSLHRRATVNDVDAPRALALDAATGVAC